MLQLYIKQTKHKIKGDERMENASKALIIAGTILISILLISVGILIFNSSSGTTNNAGAAGDAMEIAARKEKVKIILSNMDIKDEGAFFEYIRYNYGTSEYLHQGSINTIARLNLTAEDAKELCELIVQRSIMLCGKEYNTDIIHLTSSSDSEIYYDKDNQKIVDNIDNIKEGKKYQAGMFKNTERGFGYSISIKEWIN